LILTKNPVNLYEVRVSLANCTHDPLVLKSLYIKSHVLIDEVEVGFHSGLNVLTGETGAGKSTILEALSLILGDRASADVVRKGSEKAVVEGTFNVAGNNKVKKLLGENQIELSDDLLIRREVSVKGQSRCFLNDTPATLSVLGAVGDLLVDLHGQHQHQSLLRVETHIDMLDEFGGTGSVLSEFQRSFGELQLRIGELRELRQRELALKEKRDLYEFQLKEIDAVSPRAREEDELERELRILENAEKLYESTTQLYGLLYESENSLRDQLAAVVKTLEGLISIDGTFEDSLKEASSAEAIIDEMAKTFHGYRSRIEFSPEKLEQVRERLGNLSLLKKKYGKSVEAILEHRDRIAKEISLAENFETAIAELRGKIAEEQKKCSDLAERLSEKRKETAKRLNKAIMEELAVLGIPNASFEVRIENKTLDETGIEVESIAHVRVGKKRYETTAKGIDLVEFFITTNIGEDLKPLAKVASGGEISRIMLALKTVLAKSERLPLLIFDEIDIGISGRIAQAVGMSLKNLSKSHQIIVITHLPQIAGAADHHYIVEKVEEKGRAFTQIRELKADERVREVARLMSGEKVTEAGMKGAKELMGVR
jgi:DNA repair protein RecN (Recombination protein N)